MSAPRESAPITVARGAALVLIGLVVARPLNYAWRIALARYAGADEFGVLFLAVATIAAAGSLATLGVDFGVARFVPFYLGRQDKASLRSMLRWSLLFAVISGCLIGLLLYLVAAPVSLLLFKNESLVPALKVCSWCLPFFVTGRVLTKAVLGFQRIGYRMGVYQVFNPLFKLGLTLPLLYAGMGVEGALLAYLAAEIASSVALWAILDRRVFGVFSGGTVREASAFSRKAFMAYGFPLFLAGMIDLVMSYTDTFMSGYYLDAAAVGLYGAAVTLASLVALGTELLNPMFLSIITRDFAAGDTRAVVSAFNNNNRWFLGLMLPVALFTVIMSRELMGLLWGGTFEAGATALALLCVGRLMFGAENTSFHVLSMHGAGRFLLVSNLTVALLNVALNLLLIPKLGIEGAALATAVSLSFHAILVIVGARLPHRGQGMRVVFPRVLAAGLAAGAVCWATKAWFGTGWTGLFLSGTVFLALYAVSLGLLGAFTRDDILVWRTLKRKLGFGGANGTEDI